MKGAERRGLSDPHLAAWREFERSGRGGLAGLSGLPPEEADRIRARPTRAARAAALSGYRWLGSPNYEPGRGGQAVSIFVLHTIVGGIASANARFQNPNEYASATFGADEREIVQWVDVNNTPWTNGVRLANQKSETCECADSGQPWEPRPADLYARVADLVRDRCAARNIPLVVITDWRTTWGVTRHRNISATACPAALDVERIVRLAVEGIMTPEQEAKLDACVALGHQAKNYAGEVVRILRAWERAMGAEFHYPVPTPVTRASVTKALRELGLKPAATQKRARRR